MTRLSCGRSFRTRVPRTVLSMEEGYPRALPCSRISAFSCLWQKPYFALDAVGGDSPNEGGYRF